MTGRGFMGKTTCLNNLNRVKVISKWGESVYLYMRNQSGYGRGSGPPGRDNEERREGVCSSRTSGKKKESKSRAKSGILTLKLKSTF